MASSAMQANVLMFPIVLNVLARPGVNYNMSTAIVIDPRSGVGTWIHKTCPGLEIIIM